MGPVGCVGRRSLLSQNVVRPRRQETTTTENENYCIEEADPVADGIRAISPTEREVREGERRLVTFFDLGNDA